MKFKLYNLLLFIFSLIGYLEWGEHQQFLFQMEWELLGKLTTAPLTVLHPFTILPLLGQVLLLFTLFQKTPSKKLTYLAISCIALLFLMILFVGLLGLRAKVLFSSLPFLVTALLTIRLYRKQA